MEMKIGDKVTHIDYPTHLGQIVAKSKKWPGELQTFLVKWDSGLALSRHIEAALEKKCK
tara:strand:+ start:752 stop:928 length:177 start_codon:yes stop_codon:yes gene_type:complete